MCFIFQSTLPAWGATEKYQAALLQAEFQSTLPAWGATCSGYPCSVLLVISIHAPRMGSDGDDPFIGVCQYEEFQSTLPAWGATKNAGSPVSDGEFQSTLPAWGATAGLFARLRGLQFQSTLPAWGATVRRHRK